MSNIFFIRHQNDFEFMMPLILEEIKPFIVIYGDVDSNSKNKLILNKLRFIEIYSKNTILFLIFRLLNKLTSGAINRKLSNLYENFLALNIKKKLIKNSRNFPLHKCSNIIFDHIASGTSLVIVSFLKKFREQNNLNFKIISVPHGAGTILNTMTDYNFHEPNIFSGFDIYDLIICNDKQHFNSFISSGISKEKLVVINSLRYTKEWVSNLLTESKVKDAYNNKTNILIIHSKFMGNIDHKEVERCLGILNKSDMFNIKIKSHPRGGFKEDFKAIKLNNKIDIVLDDIVGNIAWSDYVITFGSSAIFDAFILNKPVIFPYYSTSNEFSEEIMKGVICAKTPDEFYNTIQRISNGESLNINFEYKNDYEETLQSWRKILN